MTFPIGLNEIGRLRTLRSSGLLSGLDTPELDELCAEARRHFGVETAAVTLLDADVQVFKAKSGIEVKSTPRNVAFCNYTILADQVFVVPDATEDVRFADNPLVTGPPFVRFYAGAPLLFRENIRLGALCMIDPAPRSFSLGDRAELQGMADRVINLIAAIWFKLDQHG